MAQIAEDTFPSSDEIMVLGHVGQLYEQHRHRLVHPLQVKVTDADGKITEYEYHPESHEDVNMFRLSASPESPSFRLPLRLQITDAEGTLIEATQTRLEPLPQWL